MNRITFPDTHVYPGCAVILNFRIGPNDTTLSALAEFSDGSDAHAEIEQVNPDELLVYIDGYKTAAGTSIPEKSWRIRYDNVRELWKVVARL